MESGKSAKELFLEGYNCAQAVFAAHAVKFGLDTDTALKLSAPLGGGVGRMRNVCGAFSAAAILLGLKEARASADENEKKIIYEKTQALAEIFKLKNGSIICAELLDNAKAKTDSSAAPQIRDEKYYAARPCLRIVESADAIVRGMIDKV